MRPERGRRDLAAVLLALALLCALPGAARAGAPAVTDLLGRTVAVPANPKRVLAVSSGALRLLCYLEAADRVVGVERFDKKPSAGRSYQYAYPHLASLPAIGPGGPAQINRDPDLEAVLRLSPEVIFITHMERAGADALQKRLGIPVVVLAYAKAGVGSFDETFFESLRLCGRVLGREKRAAALIAFIEENRRSLLSRVEGRAPEQRPRVYVGGVSLKGAQGIGSTDADYPPLAWVQARNLAAEGAPGGHRFVDRERLLAWNPDILFLDAGGLALIAQDARRKPDFYRHLKAFGEKRAYLLYPFNNYATNVETLLADAWAAGKVLYPDRFADIDLPEKSDAIYRFFLGKPLYGAMRTSFGDLGRPVDPASPPGTP